MRSRRALSFSAIVAIAVFVYLSLPTLRALYGPIVNIPVYALIALLAGRFTWLVLADRSASDDLETSVQSGRDADAETEDVDVEDELDSLRDRL